MNFKEIAEKINNAGGAMYLVGGAVRDQVLGIEPHDYDFCVTGINIEEFMQLFPEAKIQGKDFPVFILNGCEVALARTEEKVSEGYKGFKINTSKDITIEDDLRRRDLTINAIAVNVLTSEIFDPFGGIDDLRNGNIRHVSSAFSEDPLRAYRAARFAAKFGFKVDNETLKLINDLKPELNTIKPERLYVELEKALSSKTPSIFFEVLRDAKVLDVHFKEINDLVGVIQPEKYHPEGDAFNHSMIVLDKVANKTPDVAVRFAGLVHDLGKGTTPVEELPRHIGHDERGIYLVETLSNRLKLPKKWQSFGCDAARLHMKAAKIKEMRPAKLAKFLYEICHSKIGAEALEIIVQADEMTDRPLVEFAKLARTVREEVSGKTLMAQGFDVKVCGYDKFNQLLFERQGEVIKRIRDNKNLTSNETPDEVGL